ncbi:MAG TPA: hypothetical protein PK537_04845 [Candidatus Limiplasma sp.]|nr:hypothetical protein [Candidatus Limiplasma sp.]
MKITDLKREHFPNGHTFSQKTLDRYLAARAKARSDFFSRYTLCLLAGIVAGFVLSLFLTGSIIKYLLPMLCVMAGALVGTKLTTASLEDYRMQAEKIRLTKKDLRAAKKHLRNGTVAWGETQEKIEE